MDVAVRRLTEINGEPAPAGPPVEIVFEADDRIHGTAGVNRFTGSCRIGEDLVEFGPLATTLMAGLPEAMALERGVLQCYRASSRWRSPTTP